MLRWWDVARRRPRSRRSGVSRRRACVYGIAFTPRRHGVPSPPPGAAPSSLRDACRPVARSGRWPRTSRSANAVSFSPDGTRFVSSGNDGHLVVLERRRRRARAWSTRRRPPGDSVAWSSDGRLDLRRPLRRPTATLWDADDRRVHPDHLRDAAASMTAVAFSADGRVVARSPATATSRSRARTPARLRSLQPRHTPGGAHAARLQSPTATRSRPPAPIAASASGRVPGLKPATRACADTPSSRRGADLLARWSSARLVVERSDRAALVSRDR